MVLSSHEHFDCSVIFPVPLERSSVHDTLSDPDEAGNISLSDLMDSGSNLILNRVVYNCKVEEDQRTQYQLRINGDWCESEDTIAVSDVANDSVSAEVAPATPEQAEEA